MSHIDILALICYFKRTAYLFCKKLIKLFYKIHHAVIIGISLIKLYCGKFGIVLCIHALVAENTTYFINPVHSADDKTLQIKLCLYTKIHIHIKSIVMCLERTCGRAYLYRYKYRRINFEKSLFIEIVSYLFKYT